MNNTLTVIVDASGSMNEMGKIHLQRNLCRYVTQLRLVDQKKYTDFGIRFYLWAQNISDIAVESDGDIPALYAEGSSSLNVLSDFLSQNINNIDRSKVLILSDGNFDRDDYQLFLKWKDKVGKMLIRTIAVGADADLLKLRKISTNNSVYLAENIASVLDSTIFNSYECIDAPVSTAQILHSEPAESVE